MGMPASSANSQVLRVAKAVTNICFLRALWRPGGLTFSRELTLIAPASHPAAAPRAVGRSVAGACCCFPACGSRCLLRERHYYDCVAFRLYRGWNSPVELETIGQRREAQTHRPGLLEGRGNTRKLRGETRSRFRRKRCQGNFHGPLGTGLRGVCWLNRFESASGQRYVFASPCKGKAILLGLAADAN